MEESAPQYLFYFSPQSLLIIITISDSDGELFMHIAKAFYENGPIQKRKWLYFLVVYGLKCSSLPF